MKVNYQYASPSMCLQKEGHTTLGLSPDLSRDEKVSFQGKLKHPLVFRDAMLMLREIVVSDTSIKTKERTAFFEWLNEEIERRVMEHEKSMPHVRQELQMEMDQLMQEMAPKDAKIMELNAIKNELRKKIDKYDIWQDYYAIEGQFWKFIKQRDMDLWFVLDPVITVHPEQVTFEAFSVDESIYGCLSIGMDEFEMRSEPKLGTTNIDFSAKLAKEMERFRTYSDVELSVNPEGFAVDSGITPEHIEKKIDLPETWIKGFNQVSSAAILSGVTVELSQADMYDICSFMRRHKENKSPRYMKWVFEKDKPVKIVFEPFHSEITLSAIYRGEKKREEKIWGRRRWLVVEKLIPIAKSFQVKLLGFGMPQFITADLGNMKMTIGFSSWSANDWVKGTAFNIMSGFIGEGNYHAVYELLKKKRFLSIEDICTELADKNKTNNIAGIGNLLKRGEGYFDLVNNVVRFRRLCSEPIPAELYETTPVEYEVQKLVKEGMENFSLVVNDKKEYLFKNSYKNKKGNWVEASLAIDEDGQICALNCQCRDYQKGPRNISAPCSHILALYMVSVKFTKLEFEHNREYKINDIMEMLL